MPKRSIGPAWEAGAALVVAALLATGCTTPLSYHAPSPVIIPAQTDGRAQADEQFARLASAMARDLPGSGMLTASPGTCGPAGEPVMRVVIPEQILFATASDQPAPNAGAALDDIAGRIRQQAPGAELTVLGHTDAVGSDAYNIDLSKRRAATVMHALVARGLDAPRLSMVAIGRRQPIADNATAEGRARNRRVEFLLSRCLAANLDAVTGLARSRSLLAPDEAADGPVEVLRLDPAAAYGLAPLAAIDLRPPDGLQKLPAAVKTSISAQPSAVRPAAGVAQPAPAPHYQPRTLIPDVQRSPLGAAVPF
jgi:outer membrane protein OmpA-like peptidoglycan-associated protein